MSAGQTRIPNSWTSEDRPEGLWHGEPQRAMVALAISIVFVFIGVGLLLVVRRFAGALSVDLPRETMLLTAVVTTAVLACVRIAWRKKFPLAVDDIESESSLLQRLGDKVVGYGSSLALVLLAVGCSYPANRTSDWLIWLPLLLADQFWRQTFFDAGHPGLDFSDTDFNLENELALGALVSTENEERIVFGGAEPPFLPQSEETEEVVQQLYRVRDELGQEVIYGTLRADFLTGQRTAVVHAGFCPPLSHLPEIEAESFGGPAARIKVVQALAHGTRMDVRLTSPATSDCHVWIDMAATPTMCQEKSQEKTTPQEKIAS